MKHLAIISCFLPLEIRNCSRVPLIFLFALKIARNNFQLLCDQFCEMSERERLVRRQSLCLLDKLDNGS